MSQPHSSVRDELEDHDRGLSHDLPLLVERSRWGRRGLLSLLGGVGAAALAGCADDALSTPTATTGGGSATAGTVVGGEIPEETTGPYPGDGSNGVNVLSESGIVRSDLRSSFGSASGVAEGVPVSVRLKVYDLTGSEVSALAGVAVYLWHCNRDGEYSMYSPGVVEENYLRGVQESGPDGSVEFTSIFPAAYDGRWPHMHFEVYGSLADATSYTNKLRTSQLALPEAVCQEVYAGAAGYEASAANLAATSLDRDLAFSDGVSLQMATATGSVDDGYTIALNVPV